MHQVSCLLAPFAPAIHLSLLRHMGLFRRDNMLYAWPLEARRTASKEDLNIVTAHDIF